ncbi:MAG: 2OG-Fe(II) oxygenase [Gammaproteobacteria bacterium]|nr:2OG-Fe(II) oxygenase [Gammaproteobacteria bacterium]
MMAGDERDPRLERYDWQPVLDRLDQQGFSVLESLMSARECGDIAAAFERDDSFRSHIVMQRFGFGEGEYKYFAYPLPPLVEALRRGLYERLVDLANDWSRKIHRTRPYPTDHDGFLKRCHAREQRRPTPLLLRYRTGDYNRLHQDLYGETSFPLQITVLLDRPGQDFEGGEFVLTEQKPRSQSRVRVVPLAQGDAVVFAVNERPVKGTRGYYRLKTRHGVSELRAGLRRALGIIFHDAA